MSTSTATADMPLRQAGLCLAAGRRAGSPLTASTDCVKSASASRGSALSSRVASWRFRHEQSWI